MGICYGRPVHSDTWYGNTRVTMGGNKGKRYEEQAEERAIRPTSIDEYASAINAESERKFRKATRDSLTRVAPGDARKAAQKQRRVTRDIGIEPIASYEEFTNALLTALGWLAGELEPGAIDFLVGETQWTGGEHRSQLARRPSLSRWPQPIRARSSTNSIVPR
ncbi:MAG: hypothetical protein KDA63_00550 [Planctomycetales bacterium]|nr:hypothetical protein [Planctomycetales bacterium]